MTAILIATDKFAGTLSALEAAEAIRAGWASVRPGDTFDLCPLADGGPGFLDVLHASLGGELRQVELAHPLRAEPSGKRAETAVTARLLVVPDAVYVEAAQACGRELTGSEAPEYASSAPLGQLLAAAVAAARDNGSCQVVIGVGGTGSTDGGSGLLGALGATADVPLDAGGAALAGIRVLDLDAARDAVSGVELMLATDVDSPLLGPRGAALGFAPQKGATSEQAEALEAALQEYSALLPRVGGKHPALMLGAGAGGGIGAALLALGAVRRPGIEMVAEAVDLPGRIGAADIVVTGEGRMDWQSLGGKVVSGVAQLATDQARPCIALAGEVLLGKRELSAVGISAAYPVAQVPGAGAGVGLGVVSRDEALASPAESLAMLAGRVARTWSRPAR